MCFWNWELLSNYKTKESFVCSISRDHTVAGSSPAQQGARHQTPNCSRCCAAAHWSKNQLTQIIHLWLNISFVKEYFFIFLIYIYCTLIYFSSFSFENIWRRQYSLIFLVISQQGSFSPVGTHGRSRDSLQSKLSDILDLAGSHLNLSCWMNLHIVQKSSVAIKVNIYTQWNNKNNTQWEIHSWHLMFCLIVEVNHSIRSSSSPKFSATSSSSWFLVIDLNTIIRSSQTCCPVFTKFFKWMPPFGQR